MDGWQCPKCGSIYGGTASIRRCTVCDNPVTFFLPPEPKTYNDGLEAAALHHDMMAERYRRTGGGPMSVQHIKSAAAIRALKCTP